MDKQNNLSYCDKTTRNHRVLKKCPQSLQNINDVCKKDGAKKTPFNNQVCINVDELEINRVKGAAGNRSKTMDMALGLSVGGNKPNMALVELRLNYKEVKNIKKPELDAKILHSKNLLGHTPSILNHYYFIFQSKLKNQAYSHIRRLYSNKNIVTVEDLNGMYNLLFS